MDHLRLVITRHLLRPTRGGAAGVLIVFAFLLFIAAKAGLTGIPLAFIVTSWFFKYAYVLFDHTVRGFDEPPTLDVEMVNPFNEQRPLAQVAILGLIYIAVHFAYLRIGPAVATLIAAASLLALPASVAVLGLEGNILKAVYPVAWMRVIMGLGPMYLLVLGIIGAYAILIAILSHGNSGCLCKSRYSCFAFSPPSALSPARCTSGVTGSGSKPGPPLSATRSARTFTTGAKANMS